MSEIDNEVRAVLAARPPSGALWVHEIKHDGYRLMLRRDGERVRCFTRGGHNWADRFPGIVDAGRRIQASSVPHRRARLDDVMGVAVDPSRLSTAFCRVLESAPPTSA